ncbi:MAG: UDP-3-O-(3-hydroxymyristoyl)glucosamine N-acyltransferase [Gemmatimonadales bacterium]
MTQPRRARAASSLTLWEVSELVGGRLVGPGDTRIERVAPLDEAGPVDLAFLGLKRYARHVASSRAGAYLVSAELEGDLPSHAPRVVVANAYAALRTVLAALHPEPARPATVHATAVVGKGVRLGEGVTLEPYVVVGDRVSIGAGTRVGAHCVLGPDTTVGERCTLHPHVVTYPGTALGDEVVLHSGARVGCDGFGYTTVDGKHLKMPQVGSTVIGDRVEVGANSTIDRGSLGDTTVGAEVKIDNLVQIAHNVKVGAGSLLAALVGIAGSTRIGRGVWFGGAASAINHLEIGDGARVTFGSTLTRDVAAGETVTGYPARPHREELRRQAELARLPRLAERVRRLEESSEGRGESAGGATS